MSDEESFVILGSSPLSSLESDGLETRNTSFSPSLQSDSHNVFSSLKSSQIIDLRNAQEIATQTPDHPVQPEKDAIIQMPMKTQVPQTSNPFVESIRDQATAEGKLWSSTPQVQEKTTPYSLEHYALKSPLEQKRESKESLNEKMYSFLNQESFQSNLAVKTKPASSVDNNLATSFLMGEINSDVLKTSVYSQFPGISMEACAEDVLKLQNMVTDYTQLKATIKKANSTMKQFYNKSLQWKEKMSEMEEQHKLQLDSCKAEIEELRKQNKEIEKNFMAQIEAIEIARVKDREENVQGMSEKNALLENMRAQIIKLERQQLASFELIGQNQVCPPGNGQFNKTITTHQEHERKIKDLQRQLSEMFASNLDFKDIEKQYIEELNCLKVNLTLAAELIKKNRAEIDRLAAINIENQEQMQTLENSLKSLRLDYEDQKERIVLLEAQNDVYRGDFEMEKEGRETAVKEKQGLLQDLRALQKVNQELIEEQRKMSNDFQKRLSAAPASTSDIEETFIFPTPSTSTTAPLIEKHVCPICNKAFKSLSILLSHVNDCVDRN